MFGSQKDQKNQFEIEKYEYGKGGWTRLMLLCIRFGKQKMKSRWNWDRNIVRCVVCNRRVSRDHNCSFFVLFQNVEAPISNIEDQEGDREDNSGVLVNDIDILDSRQCSFQRRSAFFELRQESRLASFFHSWTAGTAGWPPKAGGWTATTTRGWVAAVNAKARWEIVGHIASRPSSLGTAEAISYAWNGRHAQVLQFNDFFVVVFSCKNTIQIRIHLSTYLNIWFIQRHCSVSTSSNCLKGFKKLLKNWARGNRKTLKRPKMMSKINFRTLKLKSHEEYLICRTFFV